jgi:hypothetical protein
MAKKQTQVKKNSVPIGQNPKPQNQPQQITALKVSPNKEAPQVKSLPPYNAGNTLNCRALIKETNEVFAQHSPEKVIKFFKGLRVTFKDVYEDEKMILSWKDVRDIYQHQLLPVINKYLFTKYITDTMGRAIYIDKDAFFEKTVKKEGNSSLNFVAVWLVSNYISGMQTKSIGKEEPLIEETVIEEPIVVNNSVNNKENPLTDEPKKEREPNLVPQHVPTAVHQTPPQPQPIVTTPVTQQPTIPNNQNMLVAKQEQPESTEKPLRTLFSSGEKFVGVSHNPNLDPEVDDIKMQFAKLADKLFELESTLHLQDNFFKEYHSYAKQSLLVASMQFTKLITYKK